MTLGQSPTKKDPNKPREYPPAGCHLGILYRIVKAGWCRYSFQGAPQLRDDGTPKRRQEARLEFELYPMGPDKSWVMMSNGRPFSVSPGFGGWLSNKKLSEVLTAWRGKPVCEEEEILGQPAFITVIHKPYKSQGEDRIVIEITSIAPIPDMLLSSMQIPDLKNPPMVYSVFEHEQELFNKLPTFVQKHIVDSSEQWSKMFPKSEDPGPLEPAGPDVNDNDLPF
jgi:hypothetical protein